MWICLNLYKQSDTKTVVPLHGAINYSQKLLLMTLCNSQKLDKQIEWSKLPDDPIISQAFLLYEDKVQPDTRYDTP
jgi:hypothetical protein